ncbi:MAG: DEAD/DEAH box helicase [Acidobacteria bacterium]|nr:MAG: DEAD/DEAH box helicase [Acidobacteriota bacterium]
MTVENALSQLKPLRRRGDITAWVEQEPDPGSYSDLPADLAPSLTEALTSRGIHRLFCHQAESYGLARAGKNFVVVTPTASGKTLCYNLPVLDSLALDPSARAVYLFPTKALAQDQQAELEQMIQAGNLGIGVNTYDGDTPADMRRKIREHGRIILTNPDMLHTAILPHHPKWVQLLRNLRYVIIDELHTYRGIFGSHVCNVFRRLKRVAAFYGSQPQFFCASATIANPAELAERLLEVKVHPVTRNGSPRAGKEFIFYNPPVINQELGLRRSAISAGRSLMERFLRENVQTIAFASSRVNVEVLLRYLQRSFHKHPADRVQVRGYRGGYLPKTRREIERELREGELLGVVSTNALELGIDIGSLEACILVGYPGSVASTWQQMGRAGRRTGRSAAILVARNLPLDQFIITHPEYFFGLSPEHGLIHPDNLQILVSHVKCAAFELPFQKNENFGKENLVEILDFLADQRILCRSGDSWHWSSESYPADSVSLRHVADENFLVLNSDEGNRAIAEVDFDSAPELIHKDAIYMCEGRQFYVDTLDYPRRKAYVHEVKIDHYTQAITYSGLRVLKIDETKADRGMTSEYGEVHLAKKFPGFKKIKLYTHENLGYGKIDLPVHELHTTSYWFSVTEQALPAALTRTEIIYAFLGIAYALQYLAALLLMCDVRDIGRSVGDRSAGWFAKPEREGLGFYSAAGGTETAAADQLATFDPTIFLYDNYPGGVGFSEVLFSNHARLLEQTRNLIGGCGCRNGCPSCVGPVDELGKTTKRHALEILGVLAPPERRS